MMTRGLTRRRFLAAGGGAFGATLVGCGNGTDNAGLTPETTPEGLSGEVDLWVTWGTEERDWFESNILEPFTQEHGVEVAIRRTDFELQQLRTALQTGTGPDIVNMTAPSEMPFFQEPGFLLPLDDYAEQFGWADKIVPWALGSGRIGDTLYGLGDSFGTFALYYNKALFEEKGWQPPTSRAELEALAEEAHGQGIVPFMDGNADFRQSMEWFVGAFLNHYAGPDAVFEALMGERSWTDPLFVESIELLNDYFQRGWFGGSVERFFTLTDDAAYAGVADGNGAMKLIGTWASAFIGDYLDDWDWAPIPSLRPELDFPIFVIWVGKVNGINAASENPDAAAALLDFWFSNRAAMASGWADEGLGLMPLRYEDADFPPDLDERLQRQVLTVNEATDEGNFGYATFTFFPPQTALYLWEEFEKVLVGDVTVADYLAGADALMTDELDEGAVPPLIPRT